LAALARRKAAAAGNDIYYTDKGLYCICQVSEETSGVLETHLGKPCCFSVAKAAFQWQQHQQIQQQSSLHCHGNPSHKPLQQQDEENYGYDPLAHFG